RSCALGSRWPRVPPNAVPEARRLDGRLFATEPGPTVARTILALRASPSPQHDLSPDPVDEPAELAHRGELVREPDADVEILGQRDLADDLERDRQPHVLL